MNLQNFSSSESLFTCKEPLVEPAIAEFSSWRGRGLAVVRFFQKLLALPVAIALKLCRTMGSILGVGFASMLLILTACSDSGIRAFFRKKVMNLAKDLADWLLWPVALTFCLGRLLLAATVHPALYFGV